ncbi:DEAD/DEAH box helicase [Kocuria sp. CPCC 205231]|uniref:DEAD/DEAH box helicase n=1 Tax=Kocuria sp. CPCC 205231 TaxID=3073551 RepID=UPI0034D6767B
MGISRDPIGDEDGHGSATVLARPPAEPVGVATGAGRRAAPVTAERLREVAVSRFGIEEFREGQLEAMAAAAAGRDVLAVMPTGHGKSAIYQVPGAALPGTAVLVSPLIALQHDQVEAINEDLGAEAAFAVNSAVGVRRERAAWDAVARGDAKFLFLAPEQLAREEITGPSQMSMGRCLSPRPVTAGGEQGS